ncbi:MAG: CDP-alcohol phosphatidyltransferase family protein [Candidatus Methylomirabilales bacterium]
MFGNLLRDHLDRALLPLGRAVGKTRLSANAVTLLGTATVALGAVLIVRGRLFAGGWMLAAGGLLDALDGSLARATAAESRLGAFLDSTTDRLSDGLVFSAIAWHLSAPPEASGPGLALALACLVLSFLTSYLRARAEGLGFGCRVGVAERGERVFLISVGLILDVLVPALALLASLSLITVVQRFAHVWRQAGGRCTKP